jgi:tetratricopeptide (TPR) repeat protein
LVPDNPSAAAGKYNQEVVGVRAFRVADWTQAVLLIAAALPLAAASAEAQVADSGTASAPAAAATAPGDPFEQAAARAAAARAQQPEEAVRWYREAVRLRPSWDEGWWYLGALSYERRDDAAAAQAFARFVERKPESGPGWALRGLSEYRTGSYDDALAHLLRALSLESLGHVEIRDAVYTHLALLRIRSGQYELAVEPLAVLARDGCVDPLRVTASGLVLLRLPYLPDEVPADKREIVAAAGAASCAALGLREGAEPLFQELLKRYPDTPNLHYGYGAYLLRKDPANAARAIAELDKEIEIDPRAVYARLEIAYERIRDGRHAEGLARAREAVALAPQLFAAHNALGRILFELGEVETGLAELELAVRLAPESQQARASLAGAYARAGRPADANRERDAIRELQAKRGPASRTTLIRGDGLSDEVRP